MTSRLLKITGLFCKRALQKRLYSVKETYNLNSVCLHRTHRQWSGVFGAPVCIRCPVLSHFTCIPFHGYRIHVETHTHTHTRTHIYIYTPKYIHIYMCNNNIGGHDRVPCHITSSVSPHMATKHMSKHIHTHTHTHAHIYIHTQIYIYIYL